MALLGPFYALQLEVRLDILEARRQSPSCSVNGMAIFYTMMPLLDDLVPLWMMAEWRLVYQEGGNVVVGIWSLVNIGELDQVVCSMFVSKVSGLSEL
nr:RNA-directed DNA polymerase, eukaryota, reverse transcriptase zinc-binding domain protein [Tanacetum cinerariifolium]